MLQDKKMITARVCHKFYELDGLGQQTIYHYASLRLLWKSEFLKNVDCDLDLWTYDLENATS